MAEALGKGFRESVCAVVVTHNRLACLKRTLAALRPFGVATVVVDNASEDGTGEWLRGVPGVEALTLPENRGGSGGFAAGMRWAIARGFAWLWVMDDDVAPLPGALEAYARHAAPGVCLTPSKLTARGEVFEFEGRLDWRTLRRRRLPHAEVFAAADAVPCETACFEGLFVDARLAAGCIAPWERFFLAWDDILFGMLASKVGRNLYIRDFCVQKQFDKERPLIGALRYHSSLPGRYFHLRNFCLVIRLVRARGWGGALAWFRYAAEWAKACALTLVVERDWRGARALVLAWWQGIHGDLGGAPGLVLPPR